MVKKQVHQPGVVYFIRATDTGLIKIGFSRKLQARIKHLSIMCSSPLIVLRTVDGDASLEQAFHRHFSEFHVRAEWFYYTPRMMSEMPSLDVIEPWRSKLDGELPGGLYLRAVYEFLNSKYSSIRGATRLISAQSQSSQRTAENWLNGSCAPNGDALIELAASDPDFEKLIFHLIEQRRSALAKRKAS